MHSEAIQHDTQSYDACASSQAKRSILQSTGGTGIMWGVTNDVYTPRSRPTDPADIFVDFAVHRKGAQGALPSQQYRIMRASSTSTTTNAVRTVILDACPEAG